MRVIKIKPRGIDFFRKNVAEKFIKLLHGRQHFGNFIKTSKLCVRNKLDLDENFFPPFATLYNIIIVIVV